MRRRIVSTIVIILIAVSLLACYSTACMSNQQILDWMDTGTPQPCFAREGR